MCDGSSAWWVGVRGEGPGGVDRLSGMGAVGAAVDKDTWRARLGKLSRNRLRGPIRKLFAPPRCVMSKTERSFQRCVRDSNVKLLKEAYETNAF